MSLAPHSRPAAGFTLSWGDVTGQKNHLAHRPALARSRGDTVMTRQQTPWGGTFLREFLPGLRHFPPDLCAGEVWELSLATDKPSFAHDGRALCDWARNVSRAPAPSLLLKWIDSADWLSLQVHPVEPAKGVGKVECWYVVRAERNATLYAGVRPGLSRHDFKTALQQGRVTECLKAFRPQVGDVFLIDAGTPHALGPGLSVLELQRTAPGDAGTTLRFWDWNRRYGRDGLPSHSGNARPLHLEAALAATRWHARAALHARLPHAKLSSTYATLDVLIACASGDGNGTCAARHAQVSADAIAETNYRPLHHRDLTLACARGTGSVRWMPTWPWSSLTVVRGSVTLAGVEGDPALNRGQSALLYAEQEVTLELDSAEVVLGSTAPAKMNS